jgi:hypothetical protein
MRFAAAALCVFSIFSALSMTSRPAAADETALQALLDRARTASGAPYRFHVVSESRETTGGHTFDVTTETEGLKYRARHCYHSTCTGFYFDGERSYDANFNGTALPLSTQVDALQLTLRAIASYAFTDPGFRSNGGTLALRDPVLRAGRKYQLLSVAPRLGALLDAVIDPATGLVAGVISDERGLAFEFGDQRRVDGRVTLPYTVSLNGAVIQTFDRRSLSEQPLSAPAGLVPQFASGPATVAMQRPSGSQAPVVPCAIGSERTLCLIDSGNSGLSMTIELANRLGLTPQELGPEFGSSATVAGIVKAGPLQLGGVTYPAAQYVVLRGAHRGGIDLVLGADVFAHARITIDYGKGAVTFAGPGAAPPESAALTFDNYVPVATVRVAGETLPLAIDTGSDAAIEVGYAYFVQHRNEFKPGGAGAGPDAGAATVRIARFDVPAQYIGSTRSAEPVAQGRAGNSLLDHFVVTFDYADGKVGLAPRPGDFTVRPASEH